MPICIRLVLVRVILASRGLEARMLPAADNCTIFGQKGVLHAKLFNSFALPRLQCPSAGVTRHFCLHFFSFWQNPQAVHCPFSATSIFFTGPEQSLSLIHVFSQVRISACVSRPSGHGFSATVSHSNLLGISESPSLHGRHFALYAVCVELWPTNL